MHGHPLHRDPAAGPAAATVVGRTGAVAWIDHERAVVARSAATGDPTVLELFRGAPDPPAAEAQPASSSGPFLARVVDEIGAPDRVVILGPDGMRVELEREYVAINRHPDRLVDVGDAPELDRADLLDRLERLTLA